jgi:hypothetical protein
MRLGFIMVSTIGCQDNVLLYSLYVNLHSFGLQTHCRGNPKFDFHKYMVRVLESDFKKIVGTR